MVVPDPPSPFSPLEYVLPAGQDLYRIVDAARGPAEYNPGVGRQRFSPFGEPPIPTLYAAQTEEAAVAETLLHNVPAAGGAIGPLLYARRIAVRISTKRTLRLASLMGTGLRRLQIEARQLTDTEADSYPQTVRWAAAAHAAGYDGLAWMSRQCNTDQAYVFFGGKTAPEDFELSADYGRAFATQIDLQWLVDLCTPLHIEVQSHS